MSSTRKPATGPVVKWRLIAWEKLRQDRLAAPAASAGYDRARRALELGEQLRALREAQQLSQSELARGWAAPNAVQEARFARERPNA